jgi:toxin ParE1/3/4
MKPVRLTHAARIELRNATRWYAEHDAVASQRFVRAVDVALSQIARDAETGFLSEFGTRSVLVKRFPYRVIFHEQSEQISIVAVAHQSRRPDYWHVRINTEEE